MRHNEMHAAVKLYETVSAYVAGRAERWEVDAAYTYWASFRHDPANLSPVPDTHKDGAA